MRKLSFNFLQILFFGAPLIYAWLYIPFLDFDISLLVPKMLENSWSGFESVKVLFLFFCVGGALIFHLFALVEHEKKVPLSHSFFFALLLFFLWTLIALFLNQDINPYFASGNPEKRHGWFFYGTLFFLFFLLRTFSAKKREQLLFMSFFGFFGVVIYAFFQRLGLDPLSEAYQTRLDSTRIFATLGNPNYLAGLVLMMTPLLHENMYFLHREYTRVAKILLWSVSGLLIFWTGSYLAWIFFPFLLLIFLVRSFFPAKKLQLLVWTCIFFSVLISIAYIWSRYGQELLAMQKMQGFIARWFLWKTGIAALSHDGFHLLFGYGPDGFLAISEYFRHPLLSVYEDPAYRIDRSHNVFLDFALHFGVLVSGLCLFFMVRLLKHLSFAKKIALLFFALYFFFNIPVLVHYLLVLQILTSADKNTPTHE